MIETTKKDSLEGYLRSRIAELEPIVQLSERERLYAGMFSNEMVDALQTYRGVLSLSQNRDPDQLKLMLEDEPYICRCLERPRQAVLKDIISFITTGKSALKDILDLAYEELRDRIIADRQEKERQARQEQAETAEEERRRALEKLGLSEELVERLKQSTPAKLGL